jgi:hypothetical protein
MMNQFRANFHAAVEKMATNATNRTMYYMTPEEYYNLPQYNSVPRDKPHGFVFQFSWAMKGNPTYGDAVRVRQIKTLSKTLDGELIQWNTFTTLDVTLTHSKDSRVLI